MRAAEFERGEIEREFLGQFFAIPSVGFQELLIVVAALVPAREERTAEVEPLPIPTLRDHIDLLADLLLVNLFRLLRIGHIEHAALAVTETVHEQRLVVRAQAYVHWQHTAFATDGRDFLG